MSTVNIPDPMDLVRAKVRWAACYVEIGWKVFVLGRDKTPLPNCADCHNADWSHRREDCTCLTCHGFYAATANLDLIGDMVRRHPDGWLAVRTGAASRLLVLDFEAAPNEQGVTGFDTRDQWAMWTGFDLTATLQQRTQSGGIHMLYRLPPGTVVKSRNRVLPQCDVKAEGGYVVVPTPGREDLRWWDHTDGRTPADAPAVLIEGLRNLRGRDVGDGRYHGGGGANIAGYDFKRYVEEGCPGGARDEFFNELLFRYRKGGHSQHDATVLARVHWERCQQPPDTEWYMPWEHVEYKLERVWRTVEPNPPVPAWRPFGTTAPDGTVKVGNVTLAGGAKVFTRRDGDGDEARGGEE